MKKCKKMSRKMAKLAIFEIFLGKRNRGPLDLEDRFLWTWRTSTLDDNYSTYIRRMMRSTLPDTYESQVRNLQSSPKFERLPSGAWSPKTFPGYTVITPPGAEEDPANAALYGNVAKYQQQLVNSLGQELFIPVPLESLHLTIADLIWSDSFTHAAAMDSNFEEKLRSSIEASFEHNAQTRPHQPIGFRVVGLMVMTRALALSLVATDEAGYNQMLELRRSIYQSPLLMSIGIEQQYHFTPHITLGYFGDLAAVDRSALATKIDELNQPWVGTEETFWAKQAELRQFPHMNSYVRSSDWPSFIF
jgi:hypothetical protein